MLCTATFFRKRDLAQILLTSFFQTKENFCPCFLFHFIIEAQNINNLFRTLIYISKQNRTHTVI